VSRKDLNELDIETKISNIAAVKIAELSRVYGDRLNILSLGPLTNISLAVLIDVNLRDKVNLFIAGGSYTNLGNSGNAAEYNFRADPVAAKNVLFYYKKVSLIPLELEDQLIQAVDWTTLKTSKAEYKDFLELMTNLSAACEETRMRYSYLGFLAALVVCNESIVKKKVILPVEVDIIGRFTRGALAIEKYEYLRSGKFSDVTIFEEIDVEKCKSELIKII
jgi:inosine-uridine nucleoside N-ribohydrolase